MMWWLTAYQQGDRRDAADEAMSAPPSRAAAAHVLHPVAQPSRSAAPLKSRWISCQSDHARKIDWTGLGLDEPQMQRIARRDHLPERQLEFPRVDVPGDLDALAVL
jgi:hypothetical protein